MIKIALLLSLSLSLFATDSLSYGSKSTQDSRENIKYTVQIYSVKTKKAAQQIFKRVPQNLQKDLHLYKIGKYIALRYSSAKSAKVLKSVTKRFQALGFKDAYILKTSQWHMNKSILDTPLEKEHQKFSSQDKREVGKSIEIHHTINKFARSNMIKKADKAYKSGDESTAMLYYEMITNSGNASQNIKNNLCYLYGKRGAWPEAKKIIEKERYASKLIYAYAYGAIQTNQDNFSSDFAEYIMMDKSGRLALLAGYYFEQREEWDRASGYYKLSYSKNPSDVYNIFAYARALDVEGKREKALKFYKKILHSVNKNSVYYTSVKRRVSQLEELL